MLVLGVLHATDCLQVVAAYCPFLGGCCGLNTCTLPRCHRAGQGGKQSAKDASGKYARSAGSRLRRYNEAALQRDVAGGCWCAVARCFAACNCL